MKAITNEVTSRALLSFGFSEAALTAFMLTFVSPGDVMVDIGTHFACEALLSCRLVGANGSVTGFEPNPPVFKMAEKNLRSHPQARMVQKAIGDHEGTASFQLLPITQSAFSGIT